MDEFRYVQLTTIRQNGFIKKTLSFGLNRDDATGDSNQPFTAPYLRASAQPKEAQVGCTSESSILEVI